MPGPSLFIFETTFTAKLLTLDSSIHVFPHQDRSMARLFRRLPARLIATLFATLCALGLPLLASAQQQGLEIDIVGGNAAALPITVVPFGGTSGNTDIAAVVAADLARSGQFRTLPEGDIVERPTRGGEVNYATWRALRQDFLLVGRVVDAGGSLRVEYELFD